MQKANSKADGLRPDREQIARKIKATVAGATSGKIEIAYSDTARTNLGQAKCFPVSEVEAATNFAEKKSTEGRNLYIGAAIRTDTAKNARNGGESVKEIRAIHIDFDDPGAAEKGLKELKNDLFQEPTYTVTTGTQPSLRVQAFYVLDEPSQDFKRCQAITKALAVAYGGDVKVSDTPRVMRLAGTIAYAKDKLGRVDELATISEVSKERFTLDELEELADVPEPQAEILPFRKPTDSDQRPWAEGTLKGIANDLAELDAGRTEALVVAAKRVKRLALGGGINLNEGRSALLEACQGNGAVAKYGAKDLQNRINRGFTYGDREGPEYAPENGWHASVGEAEAMEGFEDLGSEPAKREAKKKSSDRSPNEPLTEGELADLDVRKYAATPFSFEEARKIKPRPWLIGSCALRGYVTIAASPGGMGKSSFMTALACSAASGKDLAPSFKIREQKPLTVWSFNLEDDNDENQRRALAYCLANGIDESDLGQRLRIDSGRNQSLIMASANPRDGFLINWPAVYGLRAEMMQHGVDLLIVDPLVHSHEANENDSTQQGAIMKVWSWLAGETNAAIMLIHHTRKSNGEGENTAESSRGSVAITSAARAVLVFNRMSQKEAENWNIANPRRFFRVFLDKSNMAPPPDKSDWFELVGQELDNGSPCDAFDSGDNVAVVRAWVPPNPLDDVDASDIARVQKALDDGDERNRPTAQSQHRWIGHLVAEVLGKDIQAERHAISQIVKTWVANGAFEEMQERDTRKGRDVIKLVTGEPADKIDEKL